MSQDADLIEILWKQDIDIGIPRDHFLFPEDQESSGEDVDTATLKDKLDLKVEKLQFFLFEKRKEKMVGTAMWRLCHKEILHVRGRPTKVLAVNCMEASSSNEQQ